MRIVHLINSTFQVVDSDDTVYFQGSYSDCTSYIIVRELTQDNEQ